MNRSTLFIDESGKSSLAEHEDNPFIMTGVILDDSEVVKIEGFFNYIKLKYNIQTNIPFHSYHIYENHQTKISKSSMISLSKTLGDFISLIPIRILILSISKSQFKRALGIKSNEDFKGSSEKKKMKEFPYRIMASELFQWFADDLNSVGNTGLIIADSRRGGDNELIETLALCKDPNGPIKDNGRTAIKEKCTAICFTEKNYLSGGLEITDLISYTSFIYARKELKLFEETGLNFLWKSIKNKLNNKKILRISNNKVKEFFSVKDGVHKWLKQT